MIKKELMNLIIEKSKLSKQRIYQLIKRKKAQHSYTISNEQAVALIAADFNIDISKILTKTELANIRSIIKNNSPQIDGKVTLKKKQTSVQKFKEIKETKKLDPFLPESIVNDAHQMAKIYQILYLFENSARNLIKIILDKKYTNWWEIYAPKKVKDDVIKRLTKESNNRWHGKRGIHEIYYTNIGDLISIISKNWKDFERIFPTFEWIKVRIEEIEMSRNIVAHNNTLTTDDIKRVKLYYSDWIRQIKDVKLN